MNNHKLQPVRGTKDFLPDDYEKYQHIISLAQNTASNYGYRAMNIPIFEFTEIFLRTLGDSSDIVSKEMYSFLDQSGESITLRPEFTAGIARCVLSNGLINQLPLKFFSHGPLFRYERPQKGRYRQLHQINFEYYGSDSPFADSETLALANSILNKLGLTNDVTLEINSLGDAESKQNYHKALCEYFEDYKNSLSDDSKIRLIKNPLRILDSKDENDKKIVKDAPICFDYYNNYSLDYFEQIKQNLDDLNIKYKVNPSIVRGLDYYSHTAFEFVTTKLGAQGTVLGGGRYDGLISQMSNKSIPAIGFAAGIERLIALINYQDKSPRPIAVISFDNLDKDAFLLVQELRENNIQAELTYGKDINKKLKFANKLNSSHVIFIGENEIKSNIFKIKDLDSREENSVKVDDLIKFFQT